jgi:DNA-binding beta-propeller fold protein YncE
MRLSKLALCAGLAGVAFLGSKLSAQQAPADGPYKILKTERPGGTGGFDYVDADPDNRNLFIVRGGRGGGGHVDVYNLDTVKLTGNIPNVSGGHGVAIDTASGHGFVSSNPVVMFDAKTLATIKTIPVTGNPDGLFADPSTGHIWILSHSAPNVTVINGADGAVVGTIDLGGAPEEGVSDGKGKCYVDIEDKGTVAVVDSKTDTVTGTYSLGSAQGDAGLAIDAQNGILFSYCRNPAVCVILGAADGKIITTLPIGVGCDAAVFNPATMEAISSQGDGTLTIIKETNPTTFAVEQTVKTPQGAKCSALDTKTNNIFLASNERAPASQPAAGAAGATAAAPAPAPGAAAAAGGAGAPATQPAAAPGGRRGGRGGRGGGNAGGVFVLTVVGK